MTGAVRANESRKCLLMRGITNFRFWWEHRGKRVKKGCTTKKKKRDETNDSARWRKRATERALIDYKMNFMRGCPSWQRRACLFRTFFKPYTVFCGCFFSRHSRGQNFLSPTSSQRALGDSRKLGKQTVLPKKELCLLTNLRILKPAYRVSQARLIIAWGDFSNSYQIAPPPRNTSFQTAWHAID